MSEVRDMAWLVRQLEADPKMRALMEPVAHPVEAWPITREQVAAAWLEAREGRPQLLAGIVELAAEREKRIGLASDEVGDPYRYGYELPHWGVADAELKQVIAEVRAEGKSVAGQYVAGGKRATKSERAARRVMEAAMNLKKGKIWCFQGNEKTSIAEQQSLIYKYLPKELKAMNGKQRSKSNQGWAKINWSPENGFLAGSGHLLVLPNQTEIHFLTYGQEPKDFQGWKLGAPIGPEEEKLLATNPRLFNIGAWLDEDAPLLWLDTVDARCSTLGATWLWTFSTLEGITPAIKSLLSGARTVRSRRAEALPADRRYVDDCPPGEVPFIQRVQRKNVSVMYFHTDLNPFPPNYANMKGMVEGKPDGVILRDLYGYSTDLRQKAFPLFGSLNIVKPEELPMQGTNYLFTDPAGSRPWASFWVRVTGPSSRRKFYIYREWPDAGRFGAWAVPSADPRRPGGDRGPGQKGLGWSYAHYKQTWARGERVEAPAALRTRLEQEAPLTREEFDVLVKSERDPHRRELLWSAVRNGAVLDEVRETVRESYIDPRAGRDARMSEKGGTCAIDELARTQKDGATGKVLAGPRVFLPAAGKDVLAGVAAVNDLLHWDRDHPLGLAPGINEPRLYVSEACENVIFALENFVDEDGARVLEGGCDDFADLLRYMALADLRDVRERRDGGERARTWGY